MMKSIILLLLAALLLQSCIAYQKTPVSLKEAENAGKVKVVTAVDKKLTLKNIKLQGEVYYAEGGKHENMVLDSAQIKAVFLKDLKKSKRRTWITTLGIGIPILLLVTGVVIYASSI